MKNLLSLIIISITIAFAKVSCPKISKEIDAKIYYFEFRREQFTRDNNCIVSDDTVFINRKTKKIRKLSGFVTGLIMHYSVLQINMHDGTHLNRTLFYYIDEEDGLHNIKNGILESDAGPVITNTDPYSNDKLIIFTRNNNNKVIDNKKCDVVLLDKYVLQNNVIKHINNTILFQNCSPRSHPKK